MAHIKGDRRWSTLVVALAFGLTACGVQDGQETTSSDSTAAVEPTPTISPDDGEDPDPADGTTPNPEDGGDWPSWVDPSDLEGLLPEVEDLPPGYEVIDDPAASLTDEDHTLTDALREACPVVGHLFQGDEPSPTVIDRRFEQPDGRSFTVSFTTDMSPLAHPDTSEDAIEEVQGCPSVTVPWEGSGTYTVQVDAFANRSLGQGGADLNVLMKAEHPDLSQPLNLLYLIEVWSLDGLGVETMVTDGFEETAPGVMTPVRMDWEFQSMFATQLEGQLRDLQA